MSVEKEAGGPQAQLSRYLAARGLPTGARRGAEVVVELPHGSTGTHRLLASFRPAGREGELLQIAVRSDQRIASSRRATAIATCNLWNARVRVPRAWLDSGPDGTSMESHVMLDASVPFRALSSQESLNGLADAVLGGSRSFWRWVDVHASW
jgi:hypothetical protein